MRRGRLAAAIALCGSAAQACPLGLALYADPEGLIELRFRGEPSWSLYGGGTTKLIELALPDGRVLAGAIQSLDADTRDLGYIKDDCDAAAADGSSDQKPQTQCNAWEGNVYALQDGRSSRVPDISAKAPQSILLVELGVQLRDSTIGGATMISDQLDLTGCAE